MPQRNYNRQMYQVQNLELPPSHGDYIVTKFSVEEWSHGTVCVTREYTKSDWGSFGYKECFSIGPRGAVNKIYSSLY
jgi:hypothetical protein